MLRRGWSSLCFLHPLRWPCSLSFILLVWYITLIDICMFNQPCIPGINPYCWPIIFFYSLLDSICQNFAKNFFLMRVLVCGFLGMFLSVFSIRLYWPY